MTATQFPTSIGVQLVERFTPKYGYRTEQLASFITTVERPDKRCYDAAWAIRKTGIRERRFMTPLDLKTGMRVGKADEITDMAAKVGKDALHKANLDPKQIDGLVYISCTNLIEPEHLYFKKQTARLASKLGLRHDDIRTISQPSGCGGLVTAVRDAVEIMQGGGLEIFLIVVTNMPSQHYDNWPAYAKGNGILSLYIFGDGACAIILRRADKIPGCPVIRGAFAGFDPTKELMTYEKDENGTPIFAIDGVAVALAFPEYIGRSLRGLMEKIPDWDPFIPKHWELHQASVTTLERCVNNFELENRNGHPPFRFQKEQVTVNADRYGNTASVAIGINLAEKMAARVYRPGEQVGVVALGAGVEYGGFVLQY